MSIGSIHGVGRVLPNDTASRSPEPAPEQSKKALPSIVEIDEKTQQPKPPRFPWLSRLARQLEEASGQQPPYGSTPITGENVDQKA